MVEGVYVIVFCSGVIFVAEGRETGRDCEREAGRGVGGGERPWEGGGERPWGEEVEEMTFNWGEKRSSSQRKVVVERCLDKS